MKHNLYVMQDRVSGVFGGIMDVPNDETLCRNMIEMMADPVIPEHAVRDCVVWRIGEFIPEGANFGVVGCVPEIVLRGDEPRVQVARAAAAQQREAVMDASSEDAAVSG